MPKKNGILQDYEDKKTKAGNRYTRFQIDDAWFSCFDEEVSKTLKQFEKKPVSVELKVSGEFKNIKSINKDFASETEQEVEVIQIPNKTTTNTDRVDRAKALECAIVSSEGLQDKAIIEKAKTYFNYITKGE